MVISRGVTSGPPRKSVLNLGGGTNSAAVIVGMKERGERPDFIVFADTGGELPRTYAFLDELDAWLKTAGFPPITRVRRELDGGLTLEQQLLKYRDLPSTAYGSKRCSGQFKRDPIEKWENNEPTLTPHKGRKRQPEDRFVKILGFDIDELYRVAAAVGHDESRYIRRYPLIEWGWGRDECVDAIKRAGLSLPGKSACFFCPNRTRSEILSLPPSYLARALEIERVAATNHRFGDRIAGLGRTFAWRSLVAQKEMFVPSDREMPCDCFDGDGDDEECEVRT